MRPGDQLTDFFRVGALSKLVEPAVGSVGSIFQPFWPFWLWGLTRVGWACPEALTALKPMSAEAAGAQADAHPSAALFRAAALTNCPVRRAPTFCQAGICSGDRERDQGRAHRLRVRQQDPATRRDASRTNVRSLLPPACAHPTGSRATTTSGRYHRHPTSLPARLLARRTASISATVFAVQVAIALRSGNHRRIARLLAHQLAPSTSLRLVLRLKSGWLNLKAVRPSQTGRP